MSASPVPAADWLPGFWFCFGFVFVSVVGVGVDFWQEASSRYRRVSVMVRTQTNLQAPFFFGYSVWNYIKANDSK